MISFCIRALLIFMIVWLLPATGTFASELEPPFDQVAVKGTVLKGRVLGLVEKGIRFQTIYGEGELLIFFEDIESLETHGKYEVFYGKRGKRKVVSGRLAGMEKNQLIIEKGKDLFARIPSDTIVRGVSKLDYEESFLTRWKTRFPYIKANLDLESNYERGGADKNKLGFGLGVERRKKPTRLKMNFNYSWEANVVEENPTSVTKDEYVGFLLGEYDLGKHWYGFFYPAAERDAVRSISIRTYPSTGMGYRFVETERALLQFQAGPGFVYEEFENPVIYNHYWAVHFGLEGRYTLGTWMDYDILKGITFELRSLYMPGITDADSNWLLRSELGITIPVTRLLAFKYRLSNVNDNNPSVFVGNNKVVTTLGLSLGF